MRVSLRRAAELLPVSSPRAWAFLAGSGISVPSGLPTAWQFNQRLAAVLGKSTVEKRHITSLLTTGETRSHHTLRFEQVIEILREIGGDKNLVVLDVFDDPGPPSDIHILLSNMMKGGARVMTTNFDSLIERAFLSNRVKRLLQVHQESCRSKSKRSTFQWYAQQRKLEAAVLKLHGTLRELEVDVTTRTSSFSSNIARISVGATLDALGRASTSPKLEPNKERVFRRVVRGRTVCVLGYSGSDDFDVMPSFLAAATTMRNIVWIRHTQGPTRVYVSDGLASLPGKLPPAMANVKTKGRIVVIEGKTTAVARSLFGAPANYPRQSPFISHLPPTPVRFETTAPYNGMTASRKLMLRGYLEESTLALRAAQKTYLRATVVARADRDLRSEVFSLARLGHLARTRGRLQEAGRFLERAQKRLPVHGSDHRLAATVFLAAGNAALDQTNWMKSTRCYRKAISHAKRANWLGMEATALNNIGLVYRRQGRLTQARRYIVKALKLDRRLRRRSSIARDLGNLGIIAHEQHRYSDALRYGRQAISLDRDMGNYTTLSTKRVDVAFALIRLRQYSEAMQEIKLASILARKYKRPEDEARCWSARGLLYLERDRPRMSIKYHERALLIFRSIGRREAIAHELLELGHARKSAGQEPLARACYTEALKLFRAVKNRRMVRSIQESLLPT